MHQARCGEFYKIFVGNLIESQVFGDYASLSNKIEKVFSDALAVMSELSEIMDDPADLVKPLHARGSRNSLMLLKPVEERQSNEVIG